MTGADATAARRDVVVLGGGLAGLTLAIQLKQQDPATTVTVLERRAHPLREAAHKVGESTVEIGARYFADVLGLRAHLDEAQIRKFGFRFFFSEGSDAPQRCAELGVSQLLPTPSWQIDRGRFETFLGEHARGLGVDFVDGATVRGIDMAEGDGDHHVRFGRGDAEDTVSARWLVDASGRAGLLKRKLDLAAINDHAVHAVWWRVEGIVDPNDWSDDPEWLARCEPRDRWRSTNHMCGPGYWVWLIPLASGAHSLGIVADPRLHPLETMDTHARAMDWLRTHQPRVAASLASPKHALMDFLFLRRFSHDCRQVFSADRWAITGEAGMFLDPFYSPGSDFIAIANGYIADLVARDRAGERFGAHAQLYGDLFRTFYENTLTLYQDQYALFGDTQVMPLKVIWDYTWYWSLLAPLYFAGRMADLPLLGRLRPTMQHASALNVAMQALLRDWGARNDVPARAEEDGRLLDQFSIDWFHELNRALSDGGEGTELRARLEGNVALMATLARELLDLARTAHPGIDDHGLDALLVDAPPVREAPLLPVEWLPAATAA